MPSKKRHNWKARQAQVDEKKSQTLSNVVDMKLQTAVEGDTNILALPSKRSKKTKQQNDGSTKRQRLNSKQKKRLKKILERKEKSSKRAEIIERLSMTQLPNEEQKLLKSSATLGQKEKEVRLTDSVLSNKPLQTEVESTKRRKRRKKRKTRLEKVLLTPLPAQENAESISKEDEELSTESSDQQDVVCDQEDVIADSEKVNFENLPPATSATTFSEVKLSGHNAGSTPNESSLQKASKQKILVGKPLSSRPSVYVPVARRPEIESARLALPILSEEQEVMEAINDNPVVILCGETGSGKTTQLPQFLYEAGYTKKYGGSLIGVTEPRRVAAISMSSRVALEMNLPSSKVSYQIRYQGNITGETEIKFMTDGVLLKEIERDFLLTRYSVIMIDEAHERSVFTDILVGLLSRIVPLRSKNGQPLKLVISSATLRVEDFTENKHLFPVTPPIITIESRQYPVTVHFNKRTPTNYVTEAYRKVCKIHRKLKMGNILVFVTGQREVLDMCHKLRNTFPMSTPHKHKHAAVENRIPSSNEMKKRDLKIDLDDYSAVPAEDEPHLKEDEEYSSGSEMDFGEDDKEFLIEHEEADEELPLLVLPLYSLLSSDQQAKVFDSPPEGVRLCVIATNVAETSITIPNIKYVVDTGKVKNRFYDSVTGISQFRVVWTSVASANQRAGRAGRTEPGHCYRLYSSAVFQNEFEKFSKPEITRRPVDDLLLQMKAMNIDKVVNFPFPAPPEKSILESSERRLVRLEALTFEQPKDAAPAVARITHLGRTMAQFPVSPCYAKMLCLSQQQGCLPYMVSLVSALSVKEVFMESDLSLTESEDKNRDNNYLNKLVSLRKTWAGQGEGLLLGDLMVLLKCVGASEYADCSPKFCREHGLRQRALLEIRKLRFQLTNTVNTVCSGVELTVDPKMTPPTEDQMRCLRQIVLAGLGEHVARKVPIEDLASEDKRKLKSAYQCTLCEELVYMHPASVLMKTLPKYVIFQEILETSKKYMRGVTAIEEKWLPILLPQYCTFSKPLPSTPPYYNETCDSIYCHMTSNFGSHGWLISAQELPYPEGLDRYRLFGQFLMEGKVMKDLGKFQKSLLCTPVAIVKSWANLHRCTEVLVSALVSRKVKSKAELLKVWEEEPKYLLNAVSLWIPQNKHRELADSWPPKC